MATATKDNTLMVYLKAMVNIPGLMAVTIEETSSKASEMALEFGNKTILKIAKATEVTIC